MLGAKHVHHQQSFVGRHLHLSDVGSRDVQAADEQLETPHQGQTVCTPNPNPIWKSLEKTLIKKPIQSEAE